MATSQVCQRWRKIALDYPPLWAASFDLSRPLSLLRNAIIPRCGGHDLDTIMFPSITQVFLQNEHWKHIARRDNEIPIVNMLSDDHFEVSNFAERLSFVSTILAQGTKRLILKIPDDERFPLDAALLCHDLTRLDMLVLMIDPAIWAHRDECSLIGLDEALEAASDPWMMRTLHLQGFGVNLNSRAFAMLEELVVHDLPISVGYTPDRMLDVLKGMPKLKRLDLVDVTLTSEWQDHLFGYPQILTVLKGHVELPNLVCLTLSGPIVHVANLFCSMKLPTACKLKLVCEMMGSILNPEDLIHEILKEISGRFLAEEVVLTGTFAVEVISGMCCFRFPIEANTMESFHLVFMWDPRPSHASETGSEPLIDPLTVVNLVSRSLGKSCQNDICKLNLRYEAPLPADSELHREVVLAFLEHFPNVNVLHVMTNKTFVFLLPYFEALFSDWEECQSVLSLDVLPSLKTIVFLDVDFSAPLHTGTSTLGDVLLKYLCHRSY
ncbi:hypothetical protein GALMADRAFT_1185823 [Galerina marginata CBS 339.88]|uniref:F-box domain-containing protein n=1 Tax=Galerina marginata (strain CBS 339.88) TaxID=685588 RepID=A0A067TAN8_GALM3|nr:hypothetical protein GALMADRAFT_1185823 [Galerina marginata CBS 339.88]